MKPALAQVCSLGSSLEQDIEDYAAGQCRAIELWWGKLDTYLEGHSTDDLLALLARHEMTAPVVSFQGGLLTSQGDYRKEHWASFTRRLGICQQLGVETMVVAGDIAPPLDQQTFDRIQVSLADAARLAQRNRTEFYRLLQKHALTPGLFKSDSPGAASEAVAEE